MPPTRRRMRNLPIWGTAPCDARSMLAAILERGTPKFVPLAAMPFSKVQSASNREAAWRPINYAQCATCLLSKLGCTCRPQRSESLAPWGLLVACQWRRNERSSTMVPVTPHWQVTVPQVPTRGPLGVRHSTASSEFGQVCGALAVSSPPLQEHQADDEPGHSESPLCTVWHWQGPRRVASESRHPTDPAFVTVTRTRASAEIYGHGRAPHEVRAPCAEPSARRLSVTLASVPFSGWL
jgi:hypothetical protein